MDEGYDKQVTMLKTTKNTDMMLYDNYFYVKDYTKNEIQYWMCQNRQCRGRLRITTIDNKKEIRKTL